MKYKLVDFDFERNNLHIAIDTYDKTKGDHKLPFLNENLDRGAEFLINFINKDSTEILVDEKYSVYSDIYNDYVPVYSSKENYDGKFVRQILLSNRERESLLGDKTGRIVYDRSGLIYGNSSESGYSNSNWMWNENDEILEIRIPWQLLNVSDPSSRNVLDDKEGTGEIESVETEGFHIYSFITDKKDENVKEIPDDAPEFFSWEKWEMPLYKYRLKESYFTLRDVFSQFTIKDTSSENEITQSFQISKWYKNKNGALTISLDDGTMSQYEYGVPVLEKYGINATFGLVTEWTKENPAPSAEKGNFAVEKFGWKQANELLSMGNEIASHNFYHIKMDTLSESEALFQMKESRIETEKNLHSRVYTFIFPYSSTRKDLLYLTSQAGYLFARTGEENINQSDNINMSKLTTLAIYSENVPTMKELNKYITDAKDKWLILNYHNIFPLDSKEMNLLHYHNVSVTYSVTPELFDKQIRLIRNSDYWIAPISVIGRYIAERDNSKIEYTVHGDKIFLTAQSELDTSIYNIPLTIIFTTDWKVVKIVNSAEDGIYNPVKNVILINLYPNREVIIENLTEYKD
jgi:peptidoglycan/xylan/chitin deacetylase (PgdA/CDA1 family)